MKRQLKPPSKITITPGDISRNREFKFAYPNNSFWYGKCCHIMQALKYHSPALEKIYYNSVTRNSTALSEQIYTTKMKGAAQILGTGAKFRRVPCQKSCRVNQLFKRWIAPAIHRINRYLLDK